MVNCIRGHEVSDTESAIQNGEPGVQNGVIRIVRFRRRGKVVLNIDRLRFGWTILSRHFAILFCCHLTHFRASRY